MASPPLFSSSVEAEHLRGVAAHHLFLVLARQGPKQCVQGCLRFKSYGPEVRKIGPPEHLIHSYVRDAVVGSRIANEPMVDPCPHVVARPHLQPGEMETGVIVVDLVQAGHETRDPRHLILATNDLQLWKALQYPTKDKVIGEHRLNLREELDPFRWIGAALLGRLLLSASQGREDPAREDMEGDRSTRFTGGGPESVIDGVPVVRITFWGLAVNHGIPQTLLQGPCQFLEGPVHVMHRDHTDPYEPFGVVGHERRRPVVVDL